jgi:hypothetical protein
MAREPGLRELRYQIGRRHAVLVLKGRR